MSRVIHKLKPVFVKYRINGWSQKNPLQWNWSICGSGELYTENGQSSYRWKNVTCKKCLKRKASNLPTLKQVLKDQRQRKPTPNK